jgi:hypothetical protein
LTRYITAGTVPGTRVSLDRHALKSWTAMVAKSWTGMGVKSRPDMREIRTFIK